MADNWSASTVTLAAALDWAKWDMDVPDTTARDNLNEHLGSEQSVALRAALSGASLGANFVIAVNDTVVWVTSSFLFTSSSGWVSADRFASAGHGDLNVFQTVGFPINYMLGVPDAAPFVVGTNTIRVISLGRSTDEAPEPIEIDFLEIQAGGTVRFAGAYLLGDDTHAESIPGSFAGHTNPDPITGLETRAWLLKAPDASTGTAQAATLELLKFCKASDTAVTVKLRLTGDGAPITSGVIGAQDSDLVSHLTTPDGDGIATFLLDPFSAGVGFWYGGSDDWGPVNVTIPSDYRIGCRGWQIGRIGVGR